MSVLVIGLGNRWRGDDAAGLEVASRLEVARSVQYEGEPTGLLDLWDGEPRVILLDAVASGAPVGTVHRHDLAVQELPPTLRSQSSHHLGVADAIELGRALGRLPGSIEFIGIEGRDFTAGAAPGPEVAAAVERLAGELAARPDI